MSGYGEYHDKTYAMNFIDEIYLEEPKLAHTLLQHMFRPGLFIPTIHSGTCGNPYCGWRSGDYTDPATVRTLFEEHLKEQPSMTERTEPASTDQKRE